MAIIKEKGVETNFFILKNKIVEDDLSWAAMGLLCYLLSKPDNWKVSPQQLINKSCKSSAPSKRDATYKILNELISKGYLSRVTSNNENGHLVTDYVVSSSPLTEIPDTVEPYTDLPYTDSPDTVKPTLISTDLKISTDNKINKKINKKDFDMSLFNQPPSEQVWKDYLQHRKNRKSTLTKTAFKMIAKQVNDTLLDGYTTDEILAECMMRGWIGFKREWLVKNGFQQGQNAPRLDFNNTDWAEGIL